jgi:Flp pilus assembly protein TadG
MVEFALIMFPLLLFMVVGATDISTLLDDHLDAVYAARAGARVGSVIGNYSPSGAAYTADCAIVGAVQAALAGTRNVQVTQIAIYQADYTGVYSNSRPQDVYAGNAVCNADGSITPAATKTTWAPSIRCNVPFQENSIGVAITYNYTYAFNLLNFAQPTVTDSAVMPIEIVVNPSSTTNSCP